MTQDMFGKYRYGSDLLNVTFDPAVPEEFASYAFDDNGTPAEKTFLIRNGVLEKPLGAAISQHRANMPGVANLVLVLGIVHLWIGWQISTLNRALKVYELVASVNGVLMHTNTSWSIDDSRNKFQFGCEMGDRLKNGERKGIVKNPNYAGFLLHFGVRLKVSAIEIA